MMKYPSQSDVEKLSRTIRAFAAFIFIASLISAAGLVYALIAEPFHLSSLIGIVVIVLMLYVSSTITFTGYAPKFLLFAHAPKKNT